MICSALRAIVDLADLYTHFAKTCRQVVKVLSQMLSCRYKDFLDARANMEPEDGASTRFSVCSSLQTRPVGSEHLPDGVQGTFLLEFDPPQLTILELLRRVRLQLTYRHRRDVAIDQLHAKVVR